MTDDAYPNCNPSHPLTYERTHTHMHQDAGKLAVYAPHSLSTPRRRSTYCPHVSTHLLRVGGRAWLLRLRHRVGSARASAADPTPSWTNRVSPSAFAGLPPTST